MPPTTSTSTTTTTSTSTSTSLTTTSTSITTTSTTTTLWPTGRANMSTSGKVYGLQDGHVYLRQYGTLDPFTWGGRCMRMAEHSDGLGGYSVTHRQSPRGGIEIDGARAEAAGGVSGTVEMKRVQYDRQKTNLRTCLYEVDQRMHCGGMDRDHWNKWEEITRACMSKFTERSMTGTGWDTDEDAMVTMPYSGLYEIDIYRVGGQPSSSFAGGDAVLAVSACQPERCPGPCDPQEDAIVVAVTEDDGANCYLLTNEYGGNVAQWQSVTLTDFGANDATDVVCLGDFVIIVSNADSGIIYTDDLGASLVEVDSADVADWVANPPYCVDALDLTYILLGGDNGYVYKSDDAGRTWETKEDGNATANNLTAIKIAPDNPQVAYAISNAADAIIKTENGGETWFACTGTGTGGTGLLSIYIINENIVLVGTDAGEIFYTLDGGLNWAEQADLPGITKADTHINAIFGAGCGVLGLIASDTSNSVFKVFRNIDGGASGRWFEPDDVPTLTDGLLDGVMLGVNEIVVVGGTAGASELALLLE